MSLKDEIVADIKANGPMPLCSYMRRCNDHYYATRVPFGKDGDFITAPDISQMFGELIGLWCADLWQRAGSPNPIRLVELGPGRGTLMQDALRATKNVPGFHDALTVHFVELSPVLREEQKNRVPDAVWHEDIYSLFPHSSEGRIPAPPSMIIANEFFDALPIDHQTLRNGQWHKKHVTVDAMEKLEWIYLLQNSYEMDYTHMQEGDYEFEDAGEAMIEGISNLLSREKGAALVIDYGAIHCTPLRNTLQAMMAQKFCDPLDAPGDADLTAHVDFGHLKAIAEYQDTSAALAVHGPTTQGQFLRKLGLDARAAQLARANPDRGEEFMAQAARLADADQMGTLFKVMAITSKDWPTPAGFDT